MKNILEKLQAMESFTANESHEIISKMATNVYSAEEMSAFVFGLNMRALQAEEIMGFRDALLQLCVPFNLDFPTIDLCGTGGDQKDTFNISTLASFVTAGAGVKVTKHGNYGVSSFCGSSNILESFGVKFTTDESILKQQLDQSNICFLHAPLFHPAMKSVATIRKRLGIRTFFNLLGPLVNPARPKHQLIGVYSPKVLKLYQYIIQQGVSNIALVHSIDGYDEIALTSSFKVISNNTEQLIHPIDLGFQIIQPEEIHGGANLNETKNIFLDILNNQATESQRNVVLANAGLAIATALDVTFEEGIGKAKLSIESGESLKSFEKFISLSN